MNAAWLDLALRLVLLRLVFGIDELLKHFLGALHARQRTCLLMDSDYVIGQICESEEAHVAAWLVALEPLLSVVSVHVLRQVAFDCEAF